MKERTRVTLTTDLIDQIWKEWNLLDPNHRSENIVAGIVNVSIATVHRVVTACIHASYGNRVWHDPRKWPNAMMVKYLNEEKFAHAIAAKEAREATKKTAQQEHEIYKNMRKVIQFDPIEPESKVQVKSDIEYLADAVMKLAEVTTTQNKLIELLLTRIK